MTFLNSDIEIELSSFVQCKLHKILSLICFNLNIDRPNLYFTIVMPSLYNGDNNLININANEFSYESNAIVKYDYRFHNELDIIFTLLHEIGHCIQFNKYRKWYMKRFDLYKLGCTMVKEMINGKSVSEFLIQKQYRKLDLEVNADKLAICLYKRFKNEINCIMGLTS